MNILRISLVLLLSLFGISSSAQYITTIAGNGYNGSTGDGGPAICAGTPSTAGICVDVKGNFYLTCGNAIRKVDATTGIITTLAGSTNWGYGGDGGPGTAALMQFPISVCLDGAANVYVAEYGGHRIRKIDAATNIIATVAGNGIKGYGGDGGPAILANLNTPFGVIADVQGNFYIADTYNNRIRKVTASTGIITTIAGNGSPSFSGDGGPSTAATTAYPENLALDGGGNLYFSELYGGVTSRIRKIDAITGIITTVAGNGAYAYSGDGGPAINASLFGPFGLCLDAKGNIFIAEYDDGRIRKVDAATGIITTIAGTGTSGFGGDGGLAVNALLYYPEAICMDGAGNLLIADNYNNRIRRIGANQTAPPVSVATITVSASDNNICGNTPITFSALITSGGANPAYQWTLNGQPVGTNSSSFVGGNLKDGDLIACTLSATGCSGTESVVSNTVTIKSTPSGPTSLTITGSPEVACNGSPVVFTAVPVNGGPAPSYQWRLNGIPTGTNNPVFTFLFPVNGDLVDCILSVDPSYTCATSPTASSNSIAVAVSAEPPPSLGIVASGNGICPGTPVTFTASFQNAGPPVTYQWVLNGHVTGSSSPTYSNNSLSDNDQVYCSLIAYTSGCSTTPVLSNTIAMTVKPVPAVVIDPADSSVFYMGVVTLRASIKGLYDTYEWTPVAGLINPMTLSPTTVALTANSEFTLKVTTSEDCKVYQKAIIKILRKLQMPNAFTPNGDGRNDLFRIPANTYLSLQHFVIFDRWGNKVFSTSDSNQGWDGRFNGQPQEAGTYVYFIEGMEGKNKVLDKGTILLVR
ncbi:T9SS type B sorting domain-containing protein [Flavitalea flava]